MTAAERNELAQLRGEVRELREIVKGVALLTAENSVDIAGLAGRARRPPKGLLPLKSAAGRSGYSASTVRRICIHEGEAVGAQRIGAKWYLDPRKLARLLARRRDRAA